MHKGRLVGAALAAFLATSTAWGATMLPEPGKYHAKIVVQQATGTQCPVKRGDHFNGVFDYPGFTGNRLTLRAPTDFDGYPVVDTLVLTITSGAGTVKLGGRYLDQIADGSIQLLKVRGTFTAVLTLSDDPQSFMFRVSEHATSVDCDAVLHLTLVHL